jgi:hypothetical protein
MPRVRACTLWLGSKHGQHDPIRRCRLRARGRADHSLSRADVGAGDRRGPRRAPVAGPLVGYGLRPRANRRDWPPPLLGGIHVRGSLAGDARAREGTAPRCPARALSAGSLRELAGHAARRRRHGRAVPSLRRRSRASALCEDVLRKTRPWRGLRRSRTFSPRRTPGTHCNASGGRDGCASKAATRRACAPSWHARARSSFPSASASTLRCWRAWASPSSS